MFAPRQLITILALVFCAACAQLPAEPAAPAPAIEKIEVQTLTALLGEKRDGAKASAFMQRFRTTPEVTRFNGGATVYYSWYAYGISVLFEKDTVAAIFLYSDKADGFREYTGELPEGLKFSDTRQAVEGRLGRPDVSGGNNVIPYWVSYRGHRHLGITYKALSTTDLSTSIRVISMQAPK